MGFLMKLAIPLDPSQNERAALIEILLCLRHCDQKYELVSDMLGLPALPALILPGRSFLFDPHACIRYLFILIFFNN